MFLCPCQSCRGPGGWSPSLGTGLPVMAALEPTLLTSSECLVQCNGTAESTKSYKGKNGARFVDRFFLQSRGGGALCPQGSLLSQLQGSLSAWLLKKP